MILFMAIATIVASVSIYTNQKKESKEAISTSALEKLEQVSSKLDSNAIEIERLTKNVSDNCLAKARAFADMIALSPEKINDESWLNQVCKDLDCNELHVIDAQGIITHSTVPAYIGFDMNSGEQSAAFMPIVDDPSIEIAQEPQRNAAEGIVIQYVGVARKDAKGLVQVGVQPDVLAEALDGTAIDAVLKEFDFNETGFVYAISKEDKTIQYFGPQEDLLGTDATSIGFPNSLDAHGEYTINGNQVFLETKDCGDYVIGTYILSDDVYAATNKATTSLIKTIVVINILVLIAINLYVSGTIILGIRKIGSGVSEIAKGNYDVTFNVKNNKEFRGLSDGLNAMTHSIRNSSGKMHEASESLGEVAENAMVSFNSIRQAMDEIAYNATRQAGDTKEVSDVADIIGSSISTTSEKTNELASLADEMLHATNTATGAMDELHSISAEVEDVLNNVRGFADQTGASAKEIADAIALIENIARQTNLLSFNASIEAVRAGAAGSGFEVLAKEIQQLATRSSEASSQITETIKKLISDSEMLAESMVTMEATMQRQRKKIDVAESTVGMVIKEANQSMNGIRDIEGLVKQMDKANETLTVSIASLSDIASSNAAASEETTAMIHETASSFEGVKSYAKELKEASR